jgi:hypothetical protein
VYPDCTYQVWFEIGCALHLELGDDGFDLFDNWSAKSEESKYNAAVCRKKWDDCGNVSGYTAGTIFHYANEANPDWQQQEEETIKEYILTPHSFPAEETIERWDFLYGRHLLRGTVAATAAMGSTGKSSLGIVEALAMASGKQLLEEQVPNKLRVLLINLEDNRNTLDKRIAAAMRHHGLSKEDIGDRLFTRGKGEIKLKIATQSKSSFQLQTKQLDALRAIVKNNGIDVLSIDPFISTHAINENDNSLIREVVDAYDTIADQCKCAIHLWHHTRKSRGEATTMDSARGAGAFADACRSVRVLQTMTSDDAKKIGVVESVKQHFQAFSGKLNFAPPSDKADWYHITNVILHNALCGDHVGVVERWEPPQPEGMAPEMITAIKASVADGRWRAHPAAATWAGIAIAPILKLDPEDDKPTIVNIIKKLIKDGVLKVVQQISEGRHERPFIVPNEG